MKKTGKEVATPSNVKIEDSEQDYSSSSEEVSDRNKNIFMIFIIYFILNNVMLEFVDYVQEEEIENELADVTFEELQRARSDGSHLLKKPDEDKKSKRANKNRYCMS